MRKDFINLNGLCALVVDDNEPMRRLMKLILRSLGASKVLEASSASEAMQMVRMAEPDFITLDQRLGGVDGVDFARSIRTDEDSPNPYVPILMVSGFAEPHVVTSARDAGVNEFVAKPVSVESVAARMNLMVLKTRPFIKTDSYFGPDRRRRREAPEGSPTRRRDDKRQDAKECSELEIV